MRFFAHVWADAEDQQNSGDFIYLVLALCIVVPMGFIDNMALFGKFSLVANVCTYLMFFSVIGKLIVNQ